MRIEIFALAVAACTLSMATGAAAVGPVQGLDPPPGAIVFSPSGTPDVQAAVDSYPAGTSFWFEPGVYRGQSTQPRKNDRFLGAYGAVLNGAVGLSGFSRSGVLYVAADAPVDPGAYNTGYCEKSRPRCDHPQDLYFDAKPLRAVGRLKDVVPGAFFFDYGARTITFADDPAGHLVELSYRPFAFGGSASGVTVQNLVVENYAATNQQGAVGNHGEGRNWTIRDNELRWNHGIGAVTGRAAGW